MSRRYASPPARTALFMSPLPEDDIFLDAHPLSKIDKAYQLAPPPELHPEVEADRYRQPSATPSPSGSAIQHEHPTSNEGWTYWDTFAEALASPMPHEHGWHKGSKRKRLDSPEERKETAAAPGSECGDFELVIKPKPGPIIIDLCNSESEDEDEDDDEDEEEEEIENRPVKRRRHDSASQPSIDKHGQRYEFEYEDTPLRSISPQPLSPETPDMRRGTMGAGDHVGQGGCRMCGCMCGVPGASKGGKGSHRLSAQVMGNVLAMMLGMGHKRWSLQELMSRMYGRPISWPDIARIAGTDGGDHDIVRACAKGFQETLPMRKRKGQI